MRRPTWTPDQPESRWQVPGSHGGPVPSPRTGDSRAKPPRLSWLEPALWRGITPKWWRDRVWLASSEVHKKSSVREWLWRRSQASSLQKKPRHWYGLGKAGSEGSADSSEIWSWCQKLHMALLCCVLTHAFHHLHPGHFPLYCIYNQHYLKGWGEINVSC